MQVVYLICLSSSTNDNQMHHNIEFSQSVYIHGQVVTSFVPQ